MIPLGLNNVRRAGARGVDDGGDAAQLVASSPAEIRKVEWDAACTGAGA